MMGGSADVRTYRPLAELTRGVAGAEPARDLRDVRVRGLAVESRNVRTGDLFIAVPGTHVDGREFIDEAVERGAAAIVTDGPVAERRVPVVQVPDARRALATLAAEWYGRPAERIPLVGVTGSLGKTSILTMLERILSVAGISVGIIGSLGIRFGGEVEKSRLTTPDPVTLQRALARMVEGGAELAAMETTSHALVQGRVHGLGFALGVFTNLVLLEHREYHGSFRRYVDAKSIFFDHLRPGAPIIYSIGDRLVRTLVRDRGVRPIGCGAGPGACVRIDRRALDADGTRLQMTVRRPLRRIDGGRVAPVVFPLRLRLLGRSNVMNAALASTTALCLGAPVDAVQTALAAFPPPRRRMEIIQRGPLTVLDDTVGHPDSISAVFEVAQTLPHRRIHVVYAVRGQRGAEINRRDAEALAIWGRNVGVDRVVVTSSTDGTDDVDRVEPDERAAFLDALERAGLAYTHHDRLEDAVGDGLRPAARGDLLLLLGAQGMNRGAEIVRDWLERNGWAGPRRDRPEAS